MKLKKIKRIIEILPLTWAVELEIQTAKVKRCLKSLKIEAGK